MDYSAASVISRGIKPSCMKASALLIMVEGPLSSKRQEVEQAIARNSRMVSVAAMNAYLQAVDSVSNYDQLKERRGQLVSSTLQWLASGIVIQLHLRRLISVQLLPLPMSFGRKCTKCDLGMSYC